MRQIKGRGKTQGNSRKSFTNAKEGKGRIREQESAGQLNNKAKTQNNISLSKNRIKTEKRHNQRMAKQIQKSTVEKDRILPEKLIQDSTVWDTIIVGAGAAGMTAALACGKEKQKVLLLDRQNQMGRKILVTGNGRCNLTNFAQKPKYYRSDCPEKVQNVLSVFGQKEAMELFQSLGIYTKDKNGYVYPYSEQAASVREAFETEILSNPSITFVPFSEVYNVQKKEDVFLIKAKEQLGQSEQSTGKQGNGEKIEKVYRCQSLLITTGGFAGPKFGCDGSGYAFAKVFGHEIIKPLPALTALKSSAPFLKKVSGVRNQAEITLEIDGEPVKKETGELQWTDYGISGVAIFQLSRFAITALEEKKKVALYFDFMPELSSKEKLRLFLMLAQNHKKRDMLSFVKGLFPAKLCPVILREAGLREETLAGTLKEEEWNALVMAVSHFPLRINGYMGYEKAQVTRGGISLTELTGNLESDFQPGLFFAGEVADVDGTCGGYNLQWAFSSGTVAGRAIVKRNQELFKDDRHTMEENDGISERNRRR